MFSVSFYSLAAKDESSSVQRCSLVQSKDSFQRSEPAFRHPFLPSNLWRGPSNEILHQGDCESYVSLHGGYEGWNDATAS